MTCKTCGGERCIQCPECNGVGHKGGVRCPLCSGSGIIPCPDHKDG